MICAMCHTGNYFDAKYEQDKAISLHKMCTKGGCECLHLAGTEENNEA